MQVHTVLFRRAQDYTAMRKPRGVPQTPHSSGWVMFLGNGRISGPANRVGWVCCASCGLAGNAPNPPCVTHRPRWTPVGSSPITPLPAREPRMTPSADQLDTFPNPSPGRDYTIEIVCPEFTSVCPKTGQPDFGTITFTYVPAAACVELKSLKLYLQRYRDQGIYYEAVTNRLLEDFVKACSPHRCAVVSRWTPRGGITTTVTCTHEAKAS
jgi:7-cyano-7-deazaguanine reductase